MTEQYTLHIRAMQMLIFTLSHSLRQRSQMRSVRPDHLSHHMDVNIHLYTQTKADVLGVSKGLCTSFYIYHF